MFGAVVQKFWKWHQSINDLIISKVSVKVVVVLSRRSLPAFVVLRTELASTIGRPHQHIFLFFPRRESDGGGGNKPTTQESRGGLFLFVDMSTSHSRIFSNLHLWADVRRPIAKHTQSIDETREQLACDNLSRNSHTPLSDSSQLSANGLWSLPGSRHFYLHLGQLTHGSMPMLNY